MQTTFKLGRFFINIQEVNCSQLLQTQARTAHFLYWSRMHPDYILLSWTLPMDYFRSNKVKTMNINTKQALRTRSCVLRIFSYS